MTKSERLALIKARGTMYHFLAGFYLLELDEKQFSAMQAMTFPPIPVGDEADKDLSAGYSGLMQYLRSTRKEELEELAADYAKVFLAAGEATGKAAHPYASVYLERGAQVGGNTEREMEALYLARGLEPDPKSYRTMHDHVGLMLEYMSALCTELTEAVTTGDREKEDLLWQEQGAFVRDKLCTWVYAFTADVRRYAALPFYPAVACLTDGFLKKETALLAKPMI